MADIRIRYIMENMMTMQGAFYESQGDAADVLKVGELSVPLPGHGEVRVKVAISGLNHSDAKSRTGFLGRMPYQRVIPHQDGAGVIDAVGQGVSPERLKQRVWIYEAQHGRASGTAAQYVVIPEHHAVPLPENTSFEIGASLGVPAITAYHCLFADGSLSGRRVLVHGGAGVVGEAAILLAKWAGAWVATTVRDSADVSKARMKGADLVIDMTKDKMAEQVKLATEGMGVDRVVEVDLLSNLEDDMDCLAPGGIISTYSATASDERSALPVLKAMRLNCAFRFVYVYTIPVQSKREAVAAITKCLEQGKYNPTIGFTLPLADIARAHEALESRSVKGKILIAIP